MSIDWGGYSARGKTIAHIKPQLLPADYGKWSLTDIMLDANERRHMAYFIFDGLDASGTKQPGREFNNPDGTTFTFRFEVLTRQACCRDKNGVRFWDRAQGREVWGDEKKDLLPEVGDMPKPGDVVEWKAQRKAVDEQGNEVDARTLKRWAINGERPEDYVEFIVDKDGCINVPYPFALAMLTRKGQKISQPRFRKIDKADKTRRKLTNWWFREAPPTPEN
ncbi:MAG: hypothetical protein GY851_09190 [bacterium]|nr:hypothetical protein [bacterium]